MAYKLKKIKYSFDALEPFIDRETMEIHHTKHHQTYLDKLNEIVDKTDVLGGQTIPELLKDIDLLPKEIRENVRFFAGGVYNHDLFFEILRKDAEFKGKIKEMVVNDFGSFEEFKKQFSENAMKLQGSGWTWLVIDKEKHLKIINLANQNNPISMKYKPLLGLDMWEHAYYLKHQNKKAKYIEAFFNVIDWNYLNANL